MNLHILLIASISFFCMQTYSMDSAIQPAQQQHSLCSPVSDDSISAESISVLYACTGEQFLLEMPGDNSLNERSSASDLKELMSKNNIIPSDFLWDARTWEEEDWNAAIKCLIERADGKDNIYNQLKKKISIDELPKLIPNAKAILKSFLSDDGIDPLSEKCLIKQDACSRLFTYAQLAKVIKEKQLKHIQLPRKFLIIQNKTTNEYITNKKIISKLLDDLIKVRVRNSAQLELKVDCVSDTYVLRVCADRKINTQMPLSQDALNDLEILIDAAPFDLGNDNIFSNDQMDAIIIDTEYKGESKKSTLSKLARYKNSR